MDLVNERDAVPALPRETPPPKNPPSSPFLRVKPQNPVHSWELALNIHVSTVDNSGQLRLSLISDRPTRGMMRCICGRRD